MDDLDEFLDEEYFDDLKTKRNFNSKIKECYVNMAVADQSYNDLFADELGSSDYGEMVYRNTDKGTILVDDGHSIGKTFTDENLYIYLTALENTQAVNLLRKAQRLERCLGAWVSDYYRFQSIKNIKRVELCKDKFCYNCQSMLAQKRYQRYLPRVKELSHDYQLLHIVFTVPNTSFGLLQGSVDQMYKVFSYLIRYLDGRAKIASVDFNQYGYVGALRALEITLSKDHKEFHPHFHCLFAFRKEVKFFGAVVNSYSFKKGIDEPQHFFTDFEILLQKIWYLLMNGIVVTKDSIDGVTEGYDVLSMPAEGHEHEVFKYATKGVFKEGVFDTGSLEADFIFSYLQPVMDHRRLIQGYGVFRNFKDLNEPLEKDFTEWYLSRVRQLNSIEPPTEVRDTFDQIYDNRKSIHYMSKFNLKSMYLREVGLLDGDLDE